MPAPTNPFTTFLESILVAATERHMAAVESIVEALRFSDAEVRIDFAMFDVGAPLSAERQSARSARNRDVRSARRLGVVVAS